MLLSRPESERTELKLLHAPKYRKTKQINRNLGYHLRFRCDKLNICTHTSSDIYQQLVKRERSKSMRHPPAPDTGSYFLRVIISSIRLMRHNSVYEAERKQDHHYNVSLRSSSRCQKWLHVLIWRNMDDSQFKGFSRLETQRLPRGSWSVHSESDRPIHTSTQSSPFVFMNPLFICLWDNKKKIWNNSKCRFLDFLINTNQQTHNDVSAKHFTSSFYILRKSFVPKIISHGPPPPPPPRKWIWIVNWNGNGNESPV